MSRQDDLASEAIDQAFQAEVKNLFANFVTNVITEQPEADVMFRRGFKTVCQCRIKAKDTVLEDESGDTDL